MGNIILYIIIGLVAGIFSGLFGIGGAMLLIPAMIYILGFNQYQAQGTTLALMVPPIGLLAAWKYYREGNVSVSVAIFMCLGFFIGAFFGAVWAHKVSEPLLKKLFGLLLLIISLRIIFFK